MECLLGLADWFLGLIFLAILGAAVAAFYKYGSRIGDWLWELRTQGILERLGEQAAKHASKFGALTAGGCQTALAVVGGVLLAYTLLPYAYGDAAALCFGIPFCLAPLCVYWMLAMVVTAIAWRFLTAGGILLVVEGLLLLILVPWIYYSEELPRTPLGYSFQLLLGAVPLVVGILLLVVAWRRSRKATSSQDME